MTFPENKKKNTSFLLSSTGEINCYLKHTYCCSVAKSCASLRPQGLEPARLLCPWDFPSKNTGVGCRALLQEIFLTQGSNPCLLHFRQDSLPSESPGKPKAQAPTSKMGKYHLSCSENEGTVCGPVALHPSSVLCCSSTPLLVIVKAGSGQKLPTDSLSLSLSRRRLEIPFRACCFLVLRKIQYRSFGY